MTFVYLWNSGKLSKIIDIMYSFSEEFMESSEIEHSHCIFNNKIGFYNINFIKHGIVEDREFFEGLVKKRERKGRIGETMIVDDGVFGIGILSELNTRFT